MPTKPMLARVYKGEALPEVVYVQPKLDGVRCLAAPDGSLTSRTGKPIYFPTLAERIRRAGRQHVLDGELYIHGLPFQEIAGKVSTKKETAEKLQLKYMVYDVVSYAPFSERAKEVRQINADKLIKPVHTYRIISDSVEHYLRWWLAFGYEGLIIRTDGVPYEQGKRSKSLYKYKRFHDAEYEISDVIEGKGKNKGTAVFICLCSKSGFAVTAPGNYSQKRFYWENRKSFIGKMLTVKYQELTNAGIPRFPIAKAIRNE